MRLIISWSCSAERIQLGRVQQLTLVEGILDGWKGCGDTLSSVLRSYYPIPTEALATRTYSRVGNLLLLVLAKVRQLPL